MNLIKIMELKPEERGEDEWYKIGLNHGYGSVARLFKGDSPLPLFQHSDYIRSMIAAYRQEAIDCTDPYYRGYYVGYIDSLLTYRDYMTKQHQTVRAICG